MNKPNNTPTSLSQHTPGGKLTVRKGVGGRNSWKRPGSTVGGGGRSRGQEVWLPARWRENLNGTDRGGAREN